MEITTLDPLLCVLQITKESEIHGLFVPLWPFKVPTHLGLLVEKMRKKMEVNNQAKAKGNHEPMSHTNVIVTTMESTQDFGNQNNQRIAMPPCLGGKGHQSLPYRRQSIGPWWLQVVGNMR